MTKLGPTGEFPRGKLNPNDEGGLTLAVGDEGGMVRIDFGKKIKWLAMTPEEALTFASAIASHAMRLKRAPNG